MSNYVHCDCGLLTGAEFSHVSAALQALLHVPKLRQFLANDLQHRTECRSIFKCMVCPFQILAETMSKKAAVGVADASFFVNKWKGLSCAMQDDLKKDPYEVLCLFLTRIRGDEFMRKLGQTPEDNAVIMSACAVSKIFQTVMLKEVLCRTCGSLQKKYTHLAIEIHQFSNDVSKDVQNILKESSSEACPQCFDHDASGTTLQITLPSTLILHSKMYSPTFKWQGTMTICGENFDFLGCIVDVEEPFYVSMCPDGKMRTFKNSQVAAISPAKFFMSHYLQEGKLTLLYTKKQKMVSLLKQTPTPSIQKRFANVKITNFPNMDMVEPEPTRKQKSTQTQVKEYRDASTQTDITKTKLPLVSFESCKNHNKFKFFTGVSVDDFEALFNLVGGDNAIRTLKMKYRLDTPKKVIVSQLSSRDRLMMLLLRLRRGLALEEIAFAFGVQASYAGEICYVMTRLVYLTFKSMEKIMFVSAAHQKRGKPKVMRPFKNLRVILDGMSIFTQTPSNFEHQGNTFSRYKAHNVVIFAVGISSHGATIFCSEGFEGNMSDKETILQSGLMDMLEEGDGVMTDRGYELTAELQAKGCHFYKPPSLGDRKAFTAEEEILTKAVAEARIYCEHAIADIKDWSILHGDVPLNMLPVLSDIVYIVAFMRNFSPDRIVNKKFTPESKVPESQ